MHYFHKNASVRISNARCFCYSSSTPSTTSPAEKLTPALRQHSHFKRLYPNHLLLFQVGDFYEMFHDDAVKGAELLDLALMSKKKTNSPNQCGFPVDKLEPKLEILVRKGALVAVCEQVADGEGSQNKAASTELKKREITRLGMSERSVLILVLRLVTPGTIIEENIVSARKNNYLIAIYLHNQEFLHESEVVYFSNIIEFILRKKLSSCCQSQWRGLTYRLEKLTSRLPRKSLFGGFFFFC
jgi:DNA mismatch repair ATPase MutS